MQEEFPLVTRLVMAYPVLHNLLRIRYPAGQQSDFGRVKNFTKVSWTLMTKTLKQYLYNDHSCLMLFHVSYMIVCVYVIIVYFTIADKMFLFNFCNFDFEYYQ